MFSFHGKTNKSRKLKTFNDGKKKANPTDSQTGG